LWENERNTLLRLLEARVLLREMLEFKLYTVKPTEISGPAVELRKLIAIYPDDEEDDSDLIAQIAELRKQLIIQLRDNQQVERELALNEKKSALLIISLMFTTINADRFQRSFSSLIISSFLMQGIDSCVSRCSVQWI